MIADPEPNNTVALFDPEGSVIYADADGPELLVLTDFFEMQRWMCWIKFEKPVVFIGQLLNLFG